MASCGRTEEPDIVESNEGKKRPSICLRCKDPSSPIYASLGTNIAYCRECLVVVTGAKIRRNFELALERERSLNGRRKNDTPPQAVIAVKDNDGSRVIIHSILPLAIQRNSRKPKIFKDAIATYLLNDTLDKGHSALESFCSTASMPLEKISFPSASAQTSIVPLLQDHYSKATIFIFCDDATSLASKAIECISTGRGWALAEETGNLWNMGQSKSGLNTVGVRPLASVGKKELQLFCDAKDIPRVVSSDSIKIISKSIKTICREFVSGLDASMPSTVPTIMRTVGKVGIRSEQPDVYRCLLCGMPAESGSKQWRDNNSMISLNRETNDTVQSTQTVTDQLCYGCIISHPNLKTEDLPDFLKVNLQQRQRKEVQLRERDKEDIVKEFLLD